MQLLIILNTEEDLDLYHNDIKLNPWYTVIINGYNIDEVKTKSIKFFNDLHCVQLNTMHGELNYKSFKRTITYVKRALRTNYLNDNSLWKTIKKGNNRYIKVEIIFESVYDLEL